LNSKEVFIIPAWPKFSGAAGLLSIQKQTVNVLLQVLTYIYIY
jgi:hypothetical protein